jgi:DNA-binding transcriptional LysR family regulator
VIGHLDEFRVADAATFLAVLRFGSVTLAARELDVTPSQVSKAIARLEAFLKTRLVARSGRGIVATEQAKQLRPELEDLVRRTEELQRSRRTQARLTIVGPSYIAQELFGPISARLSGVHVRALEAGTATIRVYAEEDVIDVALTLSAEKLPPKWVSHRVGPVRLSLFGSPRLAEKLGKRPSLDRIKEIPFVVAVQYRNGVLLPGDDGCPLPRSERTPGNEATTAAVAFEMAASCNQLAYGPELAARRLVASRSLVPIDVPDLAQDIDLFMHTNSERVLARVHKEMLAVVARIVEGGGARLT